MAQLAIREGGVELIMLTRAGRELDRRVFDLEDGDLAADDVRRLIEACVPVVDGMA